MKKIARLFFYLFKFLYIYSLGNNWIKKIIGYPMLINCYMQSRFIYKSDIENFGKIEYQQSSLEMLNKEVGDCEDWSIVAKDLLHPKYHPYKLKIISFNEKEDIRERFKGHMTCVFTTKDHYLRFIDNLGISEIKFLRDKDIGKDLIKRLYSSGYELFEVKKVD